MYASVCPPVRKSTAPAPPRIDGGLRDRPWIATKRCIRPVPRDRLSDECPGRKEKAGIEAISQPTGVNGAILGIHRITDAPASLGGVTIENVDVIQDNNERGTLVFTGAIESITLGGQELTFDNVIATPTPGAVGVLVLGVSYATYWRR